MIELLVSVALLGVLMVAVGSWVGNTASLAAESAAPVHWQAVSDRVRRLIHEDLLIGDLAEDRVRVVNGQLEIHTRARSFSDLVGPVVHVYRHHRPSRSLEVEERTADGRRERRRLLEGITGVAFLIDETTQELIVTVESVHDVTALEWRYELP